MNAQFYLGRMVEPEAAEAGGQPLLYDPGDLTTHAVVVGMTGSGKTGLCIDLLEEAALQGIPALMIDPKGDITNALLHFPDLLPEDFQPWVNPDEARHAGLSLEQAAQQAADLWRTGLAKWEVPLEQIRALKNAVHFAVYTPGSEAGIPVSILASLQAPQIPWEANRELLREKIAGTVTALLGLVGLKDIDPVRSREHILLANIFEHAWSERRDLDLGELILQTQTPPFPKLGVFDVNTFFPEKDRFDLAMSLNNILAAPAFQAWIEGQPLDVGSLLYAADGRPRHSIFYIAHLSDSERMFFVTLLYSAVESWMRAQTGTSSLRALLYFDEIFGYMPPLGNPPSKQLMLRMLKQARAFGVGQILVTQNPVDVDYKALSNAGTWLIGKLQTDQDKQRLLDGLQGATSAALDRGEFDRLISALGKRVFLLHNVHAATDKPRRFQTRWAMNYLVGPLTRAQIPALNVLAGVVNPAEAASVQPPTGFQAPSDLQAPSVAQPVPDFQTPPGSQPPTAGTQPVSLSVEPNALPAQQPPGSATRPAVPSGVDEYFLPNNLSFTQAFQATGRPYPDAAFSQGLIYRPVLLAQAGIRFLNRKYQLDYQVPRTILITAPDRRGMWRWDDHMHPPVDPATLDRQPAPQARFDTLESPLNDPRILHSLEKDFQEWVYRTAQVQVRANESLKLYAGPQVSQAEFRKSCADAARQARDQELRKTADGYDRKLRAVQERMEREERELSLDETELSQRKHEEWGTHAENFLGLFGGRRTRKLSTSLAKHRLTEQAKADVEESLDALDDYEGQIKVLEQEKAEALNEINRRWSQIANDVSTLAVTPYKKDISVDLFGVAWLPFYLVQLDRDLIQLPGYQP